MASERDPKGPGAFQIPDLELPAAPKSSPRGAPARVPESPPAGARRVAKGAPVMHANPTNPADYFGLGTFEDDDSAGPSIDLGATSGAAPEAAPGQGALGYFGGGTFDFDLDGEQAALAVDAPVAQPVRSAGTQVDWPRGSTPDRGALRVDPVEIGLVADYGKPPTAAWAAPVYAVRVTLRRRALRPELGRREQLLAAAEAKRDELLAQMVQAVRGAIEADRSLSRGLERVKEIEAVAKERGDALAGTDADYQAQKGALDVELGGLQAQAAEREAAAEVVRKEVAEREEAHKRADVRVKRVHIEIRSAKQQAEAYAAQGVAVPHELAVQTAKLGAQAAELQPGVDSLRAELDDARGRLSAVEREITALGRAARGVETKKTALDQGFSKQIGARAEGVSQAERELLDALAEAGRAVLMSRGGIDVDAATLAAIRTADTEVGRAAAEAEKYLRALDACDEEAVKRGFVVIAIAVVAVLLLILMPVLLG